MTNEEFIKAISECNGRPDCIAEVLNNKIQIMFSKMQIEILELVQRFLDHEAKSAMQAQSGVEDRAAIHEQLDSIEERIEERIEGHEQ